MQHCRTPNFVTKSLTCTLISGLQVANQQNHRQVASTISKSLSLSCCRRHHFSHNHSDHCRNLNDGGEVGGILPTFVASASAQSCKATKTKEPATSPNGSVSDMDMLAQVNISGLRAATDENRHRLRRLIWIFLLSVCFAVMVAQITDRVRHFLSEPVSVQVTVARNRSLLYPAITICNKVITIRK